MNAERLAYLLKYLEENPEDPFSLYAVALEYQPIDLPKAIAYLEQLQTSFPDYLPTYYQLAKAYQTQKNYDKAKEMYEKGITLCQQHQALKPLQELKNAYQELLWEEEE